MSTKNNESKCDPSATTGTTIKIYALHAMLNELADTGHWIVNAHNASSNIQWFQGINAILYCASTDNTTMQMNISAKSTTKDATNEIKVPLTTSLNARLSYSAMIKKIINCIATKSTTQCIYMYKAIIDCKFVRMARILAFMNAMTVMHLMAMGAPRNE